MAVNNNWAYRPTGFFFRLRSEGLRPHSFLDGFPAVLDKRLFGEQDFVYSQVEYILVFFHLYKKGLNVYSLLPESGNYLAWQPGAPGKAKPELFHLRHDNSTPKNTLFRREKFRLPTQAAGQIVIHRGSNHLPM
jgi:hypothetical protein